MARVAHFDISALNADRAIEFYKKIFNWKFNKWDGPMEYWLIETGDKNEPGIDGGLTIRQKDNYVLNTIDVKNIDETIKEIEENGGKIVYPKDVIPGVGYFAQFEDTEGNLLGIMEENPDAS